MQELLFGIAVGLTPSTLVVVWLIWRAPRKFPNTSIVCLTLCLSRQRSPRRFRAQPAKLHAPLLGAGEIIGDLV
jgi:hypothetical protein